MSSSDVIFLLNSTGALERIPYVPYSTEDALQSLLAAHPELLAGDQISPEDPPRWLLVAREAGIPDVEGVSDRWSADHLLLDQHGVPTIVEVKRSTDTRIRREVIGQMLEYAANATRYWPADRIDPWQRRRAGALISSMSCSASSSAQMLTIPMSSKATGRPLRKTCATGRSASCSLPMSCRVSSAA